jgi:tetratricopeptide (TPR) repeat protein
MSKKYERNLNLLLEEIKENPDNAYAYYHIGIIKILTGEKENGIEWLKKAISIQKEKSNLGDSLLASIYNILGKYELQNERYQEAIDYFVKSSKLAPTQLTSYYLSGIAHAKLSNFHIAKNFFEIALKNLKAISNGKSLDVSLENMVEENEIHFKLMICYFKLGNYQKMKEHLLKVIHDEILYKATIDFLVEEYKLGVGNAINVLKEISTIKPSFEIFKILSGIYQINGELEDAVKNLEIALNFKDDDEIRYNLGMCLVGLRRFDEVIRVLSDFKVRENSKFFDASIKVLALAHIGCGNFEEALKCYEILLNHNPNDEAIKTKARTLAQKLNLRFSERIY